MFNGSKKGCLLLKAHRQRISMIVFILLTPRLMGSLVVAVCAVGCLVAEGHRAKDSAPFVAGSSLHAVVTLTYLVSM